jgi:hypothetical protein
MYLFCLDTRPKKCPLLILIPTRASTYGMGAIAQSPQPWCPPRDKMSDSITQLAHLPFGTWAYHISMWWESSACLNRVIMDSLLLNLTLIQLPLFKKVHFLGQIVLVWLTISMLFCHACHSASSTWTKAQHCLFVRCSTNLIIIQSAL